MCVDKDGQMHVFCHGYLCGQDKKLKAPKMKGRQITLFEFGLFLIRIINLANIILQLKVLNYSSLL